MRNKDFQIKNYLIKIVRKQINIDNNDKQIRTIFDQVANALVFHFLAANPSSI